MNKWLLCKRMNFVYQVKYVFGTQRVFQRLQFLEPTIQQV